MNAARSRLHRARPILLLAPLVAATATLSAGCFTLDFDGDGDIDALPPSGYEVDYIACADGRDNDLDGRIDCEDSDCLMRGHCGEQIPLAPYFEPETTFDLCRDGVDNDDNGQFDCGDRKCQAIQELCCLGEIDDTTCSDEIDNDGNGFADCADFSCRNNPYVHVCDLERDCENGIDDDGDRRTDCRDDDCAENPVCAERDCADGLDNDENGFTDCADPACSGVSVCPVEMNCADGVDNNGNGQTDCADRDCATAAACSGPENTLAFCRDGVDNDGNGFIDCADFNCTLPDRGATPEAIAHCASATEATLARCMDGVDNDGNGFIDCADFSCSRSMDTAILAHCASIGENTLERCMDGIDNDDNGFVDCTDFSCSRSDNVNVVEHCRTVGESNFENCSDRIDNDDNGFTDCADFSCQFVSIALTNTCITTADCARGQSCFNYGGPGVRACLSLRSPCLESIFFDDRSSIQGNEDDLIRTETTCAEQAAMAVATCRDGSDNDGDGFTDCEDWECNHNPLVRFDPDGDGDYSNCFDPREAATCGLRLSVPGDPTSAVCPPLCRYASGRRTCLRGEDVGQSCSVDDPCRGEPDACSAPGPVGLPFVCR